MSIRVLDTDGRVLKPVSPGNAFNWVEHSRAKWLHAPGIEPNVKQGTIILIRPVKNPPGERIMTQIFNGDGELLGWLWPDVTRRLIEKGAIKQVGSSSGDGPRAAILPRVVDSEIMGDIRRIEGWRIAEGLQDRACFRVEIERMMRIKNLKGAGLEDAILGKAKLFFGKKGKEMALEEIRGIRRRVAAMEIAISPDMNTIRQVLVKNYLTK